jgi:NAD(P)-dependent dehydrogenase (short-subunit alcohol dehydrogenase family)
MGIGEAIAILFASQGAEVGIVDISSERAEMTKRLIDDIEGKSVVAVGDLTKVDDNARCVEEVAAAFGRLDTIVNCAGITGATGSPVEVDLDEWQAVMAVNLTATVLTARHGIPHLKAAGGGAIVNVASIAATRAHGAGAYAASKAAVIALTRDWAYIHGRDGIRVNCVVPGHLFTPMGNRGGDEYRQRRRRAGLLGTEGEAWDVAWPVVFLASAEARWVTGVEVPVDAGTTASAALAVETLNARSPV